MALVIMRTNGEGLACEPVRQALASGLEEAGACLLFVPSFAQGLEVQRTLARHEGLGLSVSVTTPAAWVRERWEVWGDGRTIADQTVLSVLAREAIMEAPAGERGTLEPSPGVVQLMASLVDAAYPWLPLDEHGQPCESACSAASLTHAETVLMGLVGKTSRLLRQRGFVGASEASVLVVDALKSASVRMAHVVVSGFTSMPRGECELVRALSRLTEVTLVVPLPRGAATQQVDAFVSWFVARDADTCVVHMPVEADVVRAPALADLVDALFSDDVVQGGPRGAVELLEAAGPVAEAELVAGCVARLCKEFAGAPAAGEEWDPAGAGDAEEASRGVVVAVPDMVRARRELAPKLAARGLDVRLQWSRPLMDCASARAFFGYARTVAHLAELAASWPEPQKSDEGMVAQLGDMSWWPPRELTDFLLSDIARAKVSVAWLTDAAWRGNRLLTPARVLARLQSERDVSPTVAHATTELLAGHLGSAAAKLLMPYVAAPGEDAEESADPSAAPGASPCSMVGEDAVEAQACLQAIVQLAGTLRTLGISCDVAVAGERAVSLGELVEIAERAAGAERVTLRVGVARDKGALTVHVMGMHPAAELAPGSVGALVVCGLTTAEMPLHAGDDLLQALLELTGVEPQADPMGAARASFSALLRVPRRRLVLERALHDADAKETYPAVMLSELLACYPGQGEAGQGSGLCVSRRGETDLARNLSTDGMLSSVACVDEPAPAGKLTSGARGLVFVPQDGSDRLPDDKPVLSASQVETYLDCPYKWFSLRRLRLGMVDAGFGGMEIGSFAHRVLEVTHRELLLQALEREDPGASREDLLAAIEGDPVRHVEGSRIDSHNLDVARRALDAEFDLHLLHMYMAKRGRTALQLLVPHSTAEEAQLDRLRKDLLSTLDYQTGILAGFEPRLFEWGFGRHGELVEYAGAYFTGTVDRIDVSPHGTAVIIDYKHKSPAGFTAEYDALQEGVLEGTTLPHRVQSLIYAQVVRRAFADRLKLVGTVYLSTKGGHALAGAADEDVVDHVFGKVSAKRLPSVSVPRAEAGGPGMNDLLDRTEELVAEQVQRMLLGHVEARPRDKRSCDFCPVMQCERRVAR